MSKGLNYRKDAVYNKLTNKKGEKLILLRPTFPLNKTSLGRFVRI